MIRTGVYWSLPVPDTHPLDAYRWGHSLYLSESARFLMFSFNRGFHFYYAAGNWSNAEGEASALLQGVAVSEFSDAAMRSQLLPENRWRVEQWEDSRYSVFPLDAPSNFFDSKLEYLGFSDFGQRRGDVVWWHRLPESWEQVERWIDWVEARVRQLQEP